jgi:hypothetical protein
MTHFYRVAECEEESPTQLIKNADLMPSRKWLR